MKIFKVDSVKKSMIPNDNWGRVIKPVLLESGNDYPNDHSAMDVRAIREWAGESQSMHLVCRMFQG